MTWVFVRGGKICIIKRDSDSKASLAACVWEWRTIRSGCIECLNVCGYWDIVGRRDRRKYWVVEVKCIQWMEICSWANMDKLVLKEKETKGLGIFLSCDLWGCGKWERNMLRILWRMMENVLKQVLYEVKEACYCQNSEGAWQCMSQLHTGELWCCLSSTSCQIFCSSIEKRRALAQRFSLGDLEEVTILS